MKKIKDEKNKGKKNKQKMLSKKSSRIFRSIDDFMTLEKLDEIKRENKKTG